MCTRVLSCEGWEEGCGFGPKLLLNWAPLKLSPLLLLLAPLCPPLGLLACLTSLLAGAYRCWEFCHSS